MFYFFLFLFNLALRDVFVAFFVVFVSFDILVLNSMAQQIQLQSLNKSTLAKFEV